MTLAERHKRDTALVRRARRGDQAAKAELVGYYNRFAIHLASRRTHPLLDFDDLVQESQFGLLVAVERWDPRRGIQFMTYAQAWCQNFIIRAMQRAGGMPVHVWESVRRANRAFPRLTITLGREPTDDELAAEVGASKSTLAAAREWRQRPRGLDDPVGVGPEQRTLHEMIPDHAERVDERLEREGEEARVRAAVARLNPRTRYIIERRHLAEEGATLKSIGDELGLSRERIRQIEVEAFAELADYLAEAA